MSFTRISDNLFDSSLWSDSSYEGVCTLKLWLAILGEARTAAGRFRRLTPAKAARIGAIPLEMAATAIEKLTSPDPMDSSGVADGRRLLPDADGAPNDYIVANWETYGREFERASKAARQRRWRAKRAAFEVDASVYAASTGRRDVDGGEAQEEKERSRKETEAEASIVGRSIEDLFEERWSRYPKKDGKREARRHFLATVGDEVSLARFDRALAHYLGKVAAEKTPPKYIKNGSTFFNNWSDWSDWRPPAKPERGFQA